VTEHFCTLFNEAFLLQGLALAESLARNGRDTLLWVLCTDDETYSILSDLNRPDIELLRLADVERDDLLAVKPTRTPAEYYWTLTPALIDHIMSSHAPIPRVTYLDADCFFFSGPERILSELDESGRSVLITEHDYAAEHDLSAIAGRFCVQFVTFGDTEASRSLLTKWRAQCVEWCFARAEDGKFGDQGYLEPWPSEHPDDVHILSDTSLTLAPWNIAKHEDCLLDACLYHFHGLRVLPRERVRLFEGYPISARAVNLLYRPYLGALAEARLMVTDLRPGWDVPRHRRSAGAMVSDAQLTARKLLRTARLPRVGDIAATPVPPDGRGGRERGA
jgi:hypothetical protein